MPDDHFELVCEIVMGILSLNAHGINNKISRFELLLHTKDILYRRGYAYRVSDRYIRRAIEHLRTTHPQGALICSTMTKGGGYYLAQNMDELQEYLGSEERRAISVFRKVRKQAKTAQIELSKEGTQLEMELEAE